MYKRQILKEAIDAEVTGAQDYLKELRKLAIRGKAKFFAQEHVIEDAQHYLQTVSYTHLDVYKRQVLFWPPR